MTAVEFFFKELKLWYGSNEKLDLLFEQAKEMEKKQIMYAYEFGLCDEYVIGSDKFYTFTYGSEGSDEPPKEENKEGFGELSDAKIKDVAFKLGIASNIATTYFIEGAIWYRDKSKYIDNNVVK